MLGRAVLAVGICALALLAPGTLRAAASSRPALPDVELVDQDGVKVRLWSDLIAAKVVVIQAFYTRCSSVCPLVKDSLSGLAGRLGARLGRDVHIVSITLDPEHDPQPALAAYAKRAGARKGWRFVTGRPADVALALERLGFAVPRPQDHSGQLLVVNQPLGLWRKASGLGSVDDILKVVDAVEDASGVPR